MAKLTFFHFILVILLCHNIFQTIHGEHNKNQSGFSLKMIHWNSHELPSYKPHRTREELMEELIHMSNARVKSSLNHYLNVLNISNFPERHIRPTVVGIKRRGIFLIQVGIGTSHDNTFQQNYLSFETGSDHTWTQCEGCSPCFHQRGPLFSWSHSVTYRIAPCGECPGSCQSNHCWFNQSYADNGYIFGFQARDTFTFPAADGGYSQIPDMSFICVVSTQGYKETAMETDIESGVFGFGRQGYLTFMRAINNPLIKDEPFSYCFPPLDQPFYQPLYLRFGVDIGHMPRGTYQSTPIIQGPEGTPFYYLQLLDLSVGSLRLRIPNGVFALKTNGLGGCYIDSSLPMSYLPRAVYDRLELALANRYEHMNRRCVTRLNPSPFAHLPFCYTQPSSQFEPRMPRITFHFQDGARLQLLKPMRRYNLVDGRVLYCLEILPDAVGTETTIIGAIQQANYRFVYDIRASRLHFTSENCASFN
ncbi:hypothetical protein vseg_006934 [Gypsophila vaccaria]